MKVAMGLLTVMALVLGIVAQTEGGPITIGSPGFEGFTVLDDGQFNHAVISPWEKEGSHSSAGTINPSVNHFAAEAPEGELVAWNNWATISQTLSEVLSPDTVYSLYTEVGKRADADFSGYIVQFYAGDALLAEDNSSLLPASGTFETSMVTYTATSSDPQLGQPLEIRLIGISPGQVCFDDVRLDASVVPEPATLSLGILVIVGLAGAARGRKRGRRSRT